MITVDCGELTVENKRWAAVECAFPMKAFKYGAVIKKDGEPILIITPKEGVNYKDEEGRPQAFLMYISPVGKRLKQYWMQPDILKGVYEYIYNDLGYYDTMTYTPAPHIGRTQSLYDWYEQYGMTWERTEINGEKVMQVRMNKDNCGFL